LTSSPQSKADFAPINGIRMYYETAGAGKPLLLLHAGVADSRMWNAQFELFSQTHRVIRCDLRGFGRTFKASGEYAHYDDIAALFDYLELNRATVVGASFGGFVAVDFALSHPEMVDRLILAAPALGGYTFESTEVLEYFVREEAALTRRDWAIAVELTLRMWVDGFGRPPGPVLRDIRDLVRTMVLDIYTQPAVEDAHESELTPPAAARLKEISVPTLTLVGDYDAPEFRALAKLIAEKIPNARHHVVHGSAHLMNLEKPDEFNRVVLDFLLEADGR
jgi:3-oxoadipate enol-lactonase